MEHIAIDLGARESQVCVRTPEGEIALEVRRPTQALRIFLAGRPTSRVVLETCAEAFAVATVAQELGHEVVVVPAGLVRALGVGTRGLKTDVRDARHLSEASCRMKRLPRVHVPQPRSRARKAECVLREALVETRTKLINTARAWLRTEGLGPVRRGSPGTVVARLRAHVAAHGQAVPPALERVLGTIEQLTPVITAADAALATLAASDPICQRLMTVPGVGPVTAVRFAATIDDVHRFDSAAAVQSYLGLVPSEHSSADQRRLRGITKAGAVHTRWALVQAAWCLWRCRPQDPIVHWAQRVAARRGRPIAAVALARKLAGVLFAMWRDGTDYDPTPRPPRAPRPA